MIGFNSSSSQCNFDNNTREYKPVGYDLPIILAHSGRLCKLTIDYGNNLHKKTA